jgi:hypothetical protein
VYSGHTNRRLLISENLSDQVQSGGAHARCAIRSLPQIDCYCATGYCHVLIAKPSALFRYMRRICATWRQNMYICTIFVVRPANPAVHMSTSGLLQAIDLGQIERLEKTHVEMI